MPSVCSKQRTGSKVRTAAAASGSWQLGPSNGAQPAPQHLAALNSFLTYVEGLLRTFKLQTGEACVQGTDLRMRKGFPGYRPADRDLRCWD